LSEMSGGYPSRPHRVSFRPFRPQISHLACPKWLSWTV